MTTPTPQPSAFATAVTARITTAREQLDTARTRYAALPTHTRLRIRGWTVLAVGMIATIYVATGLFSVWRDLIGPVLWDAIHGDRAAFITLTGLIAAAAFGALLLRMIGRGAVTAFDDATNSEQTATRRAASGGVGGVMVGGGAMVGGQASGSFVGGQARGASAGGAAGVMRPPRAAYDPTPDTDAGRDTDS